MSTETVQDEPLSNGHLNHEILNAGAGSEDEASWYQEVVREDEAFWYQEVVREALLQRRTMRAKLLERLWQRNPQASLLQLHCPRAPLLEFLRTQCHAQSLLDGNCLQADTEGVLFPTRTRSSVLSRPQVLPRRAAQKVGYSRPDLGNGDLLELEPYVAWYRVRWNDLNEEHAENEEQELEVVLLPETNHESGAMCVGASEAILRAFAGAVLRFSQRPSGRALRYAGGWNSAPDIDAGIGRVTWDDLVLEPGVLGAVREAVEGFAAQRSVFTALGFAWRRGVLLVGPPGTGKTMLCQAVAAALPDWPLLWVRDLNERGWRDALSDIFGRARLLAPCLLILEDIDGLIGEGNRTAFLNEIDGFADNHGLLILASSNHPERIDEALLKRPSRFDRVIHIGLPDAHRRREFCQRTLDRLLRAASPSTASSPSTAASPSDGKELTVASPLGFVCDFALDFVCDFDPAELACEVAARSEGFTPAYLKEVFTGALLHRAQTWTATPSATGGPATGATATGETATGETATGETARRETLVLGAEFRADVLEQVEAMRGQLKLARQVGSLGQIRAPGDAIGLRRGQNGGK